MRRRRQEFSAIDNFMRYQATFGKVDSLKPATLPSPCRMSHTWICLASVHAASASTAMSAIRPLNIVITCISSPPDALSSVYEQTGQHLEL